MASSEVKQVESVLEGAVRCTDGTLVVFVAPPDDEADGVREPRNPHPPRSSGSVALST